MYVKIALYCYAQYACWGATIHIDSNVYGYGFGSLRNAEINATGNIGVYLYGYC